MKNLILLFAMLFTSIVFSQGQIEWEKLPDLENKAAAEILFQSKSGTLIAFLPNQETCMISKDNAKTWSDITTPFVIDPQKARFLSDEKGGIYFYENYGFNLYKLDSTNNTFKKHLIVSTTFQNIEVKNNNIYIYYFGKNSIRLFEIYDNTNLTPLFSRHLYQFNFSAQIILGTKNRNYIAYEKDSIFFFKNDGSGFEGFKSNTPAELQKNAIAIFSSGILVGYSGDNLYQSNNNGLDWVKISTLPASMHYGKSLYVDEKDELIIKTDDGLFLFDKLTGNWKGIKALTKSSSQAYENKIGQIVLSNTDCSEKTAFSISNDYGKTWQTENNLLDKKYAERLFAGNDETIYSYGTCNNSMKSWTKNAANWKETAANEPFSFNGSFIMPSGKWFAKQNYNCEKNDFFTSSDNGLNWKKYTKYPKVNATTNDIYKTQNNELFIGDIDRYFISKDEGETWLEITALGMKQKEHYSYLKNAVALQNGYVFFSDFNLFIYDPNTKQENKIENIDGYYTGFCNEIYFTKKNELCFTAYIEDLPNEPQSEKLFFSKDFGKTFTYKKVPVKGPWVEHNFFIDADGNFMLFNYYEMFISYDEGDTWISMKTQFQFQTPVNFASFVLSPEQYVYMINRGEIYKTKKKTTKNQEKIQENINFSIFPNPTNESVEVVVSEQKEAFSSVYIYSIEGKLLNTERFEGKNTTLDVHALPSGMYFLQVKNGVKSGVQKLIVQH